MGIETSPQNSHVNSSTAESSSMIRDNIERTRMEMGDAAEELGHRLDPKRIARHFVDHSPTVQFVKRHPVSLTLLALGTALYFVEKRRPILTDLHPEAAKQSLRDGMEMVKEKVTHGTEVVKNKMADARESLSHAGDAAKDMISHGVERSQQAYEANPLMIGAAAFTAGVALSWLIPITQPEQRIMGDTSRQLVGKAKHLVADAKQYAQSLL